MAVRSNVRYELPRQRVWLVFGTILFCYIGLVFRLLWLQGREGASLRTEAAARRRHRIELPTQRGSICANDGRPLAVSLYSGTLSFDPGALRADPTDARRNERNERDLNKAILTLAPMLNMQPEQLAATVGTARQNYQFHPHARGLRDIQIAKDLPLEFAGNFRNARITFPGFTLLDGSRRYYTSGANTAQVVGFVGKDGQPLGGLEKACSKWLIGQTGIASAELDGRHRTIPDTLQRTRPAQDGLDVHTTLDPNIQHIVTEEASKIAEKFHPAGVSVVVVDPQTGDILSLVSLPNFDPSQNLSTVSIDAQWERCATRLYEPGSTLKALTLAAALDNGTITENSWFTCTGHFEIGRKVIHCAHSEVHGSQNAAGILKHSCNIGAALVGLKMGPEKMQEAETRFGLLDKLDIGLPGQKRGYYSLDKTENIDSAAKTARVAFGQSITTTPLHVAMAYAAIANGGTLKKPRLLTSLRDSSGAVVQKWAPQPGKTILKPQTCAELTSMLRGVVTEGTGKIAAVPGYMVAGKTGTAQKYKPGKYVGSFIGYLPASPQATPRAVILVAVDEPQGEHYFGADVAGPAFQAIATRLMQYWRVPEDDPDSTQAKTAADHIRYGDHIPAHPVRKSP
jgi:cell division protein FtsI/penicillin-binding protein 2